MLFFLMVLFAGCQEKKDGGAKVSGKNALQAKKIIEPQITIKIEKVSSLSIDSFIKIYLSRMEHELKWMVELQKYAQGQEISETTPDSDEARALVARKEKMEQEFFEAWGVSVKDFENFAQQNEEKIQKYIDERPEIQDFIDRIQEMNMELYNMDEGDQEDQENAHDED